MWPPRARCGRHVRVLRLWSADGGIFCGEEPAPGLCVSPALQPELWLGLRMRRSPWRSASPPGEVGLGLLWGPGSSVLTRVLLQTQASPRLGPGNKASGSRLGWAPCSDGFLKSFLSLCFSLKLCRVQMSHIPVWPEWSELEPRALVLGDLSGDLFRAKTVLC